MQYTFFRADKRLNFGVGIKLHAIPSVIPLSKCLSQLWYADIGLVTVVAFSSGFFTHGVDNLAVGHTVGTTNT